MKFLLSPSSLLVFLLFFFSGSGRRYLCQMWMYQKDVCRKVKEKNKKLFFAYTFAKFSQPKFTKFSSKVPTAAACKRDIDYLCKINEFTLLGRSFLVALFSFFSILQWTSSHEYFCIKLHSERSQTDNCTGFDYFR